MRQNKIYNVLKLSSDLRKKGFHKHADELEYKFLILKQSKANLYSVFRETGEDLVDLAHPDGEHKIENVEGDSVVETISTQKEKITKVVEKQPTGKLSSKQISNIIKSAAELEIAKGVGRFVEETAAAQPGKISKMVSWLKDHWKKLAATYAISTGGKAAGEVLLNWTNSIERVDTAIKNEIPQVRQLFQQISYKLTDQPNLPLTQAVNDTILQLDAVGTKIQITTLASEERNKISESIGTVIMKLRASRTNLLQLAARASLPMDYDTFISINKMLEPSEGESKGVINKLIELQSAFAATAAPPPGGDTTVTINSKEEEVIQLPSSLPSIPHGISQKMSQQDKEKLKKELNKTLNKKLSEPKWEATRSYLVNLDSTEYKDHDIQNILYILNKK